MIPELSYICIQFAANSLSLMPILLVLYVPGIYDIQMQEVCECMEKKTWKALKKLRYDFIKKKLNGIEECSACSWQYVTVLVQQLQLQPLSMLVSEASFTNKKKRRLRLFFWQNDSFEMSFTAENTNRWLEKCNNLSFKCYIILSAITFSPVNSIYRLSFCQKKIAAVYFFFFFCWWNWPLIKQPTVKILDHCKALDTTEHYNNPFFWEGKKNGHKSYRTSCPVSYALAI